MRNYIGQFAWKRNSMRGRHSLIRSHLSALHSCIDSLTSLERERLQECINLLNLNMKEWTNYNEFIEKVKNETR